MLVERTRDAVPVPGDLPGTEPARATRVLDGRYRLDEVLGRGGMATVHRARDLVLERDVAIKLFPSVTEDADDLLRHSAEMRVLAALSHPGLVTLFDGGAVHGDDGTQEVYLVMELVDGSTLADRLRDGAMPVVDVVGVGQQVAEALALVHEQGIVHRDVKPANILMASHGRETVVKVADFGIARLSSDTRLTMTGVTLGTLRYLSPEQVAGSGVGPPSDIYSLGLVLIECLSGQAAFEGTLPESAAARLTSSPPIPDGLPLELSGLLAGMTSRDPQERPSAAEVAQRLAQVARTCAAAEPAAATRTLPPVSRVSTSPTEAVSATASRARRRDVRWGAAAAAAALVVGGVIVAGQQDSGTTTPPRSPSYPTVEGDLGDALNTLQESVVP
jgi:eukaryotic-like serine/threonine-protein kinase